MIPDEREQERYDALGLGGYDWPEVFKYASGHGEGGRPFWVLPTEAKDRYADPKNAEPAAIFDIADVARVEGKADGDNEGPDWIVWGLLNDGRWFCVTAGCDYTGWGCQESGNSCVARTRDDLIRWGLTLNERERLGVTLPDDEMASRASAPKGAP